MDSTKKISKMDSTEKERDNQDSNQTRSNPSTPEEKVFELMDKLILVGEATNKVKRLENITDHPKTLNDINFNLQEKKNNSAITFKFTSKFKESENISLHFLQTFVIGHHNKYKTIWDVFIMLLVPYSCILAAYK